MYNHLQKEGVMVKISPIKLSTYQQNLKPYHNRFSKSAKNIIPATLTALALTAGTLFNYSCSKLSPTIEQTENKDIAKINEVFNTLGLLKNNNSISSINNITFCEADGSKHILEPQDSLNNNYSIKYTKLSKNNVILNKALLSLKNSNDTLKVSFLNENISTCEEKKYIINNDKIIETTTSKHNTEFIKTDDGFKQINSDGVTKVFYNIKNNDKLPPFTIKIDDETEIIEHYITI